MTHQKIWLWGPTSGYIIQSVPEDVENIITYVWWARSISKFSTYSIIILWTYYSIFRRISRRRHSVGVVSRDTITYGESTRHQCLLLPSFRCRPSICSGKFAAATAEGKNFRLVNEIFNNETFPAPATKDVFTHKPPHVRTHLRRRRRREYIYAYNKILQYVDRKYIQYYA